MMQQNRPAAMPKHQLTVNQKLWLVYPQETYVKAVEVPITWLGEVYFNIPYWYKTGKFYINTLIQKDEDGNHGPYRCFITEKEAKEYIERKELIYQAKFYLSSRGVYKLSTKQLLGFAKTVDEYAKKTDSSYTAFLVNQYKSGQIKKVELGDKIFQNIATTGRFKLPITHLRAIGRKLDAHSRKVNAETK